MKRRSFIGSILALGAAPAIVRADSLMRVIPWDTTVLTGVPLTGSEILWRQSLVGMDFGSSDFTIEAWMRRAPGGWEFEALRSI